MKIPVRIAVAYSADGRWQADGWRCPGGAFVDQHDRRMADSAAEVLSENHGAEPIGHHFINAEIEIPDPVPVTEVEGLVEPGV